MEAVVHLALLVGIGVFAGRPTAGRPRTLRICRPVMLLPLSSTSSSCDPSWRLRRRRPKLLPSRGNDEFKPILHRLSEFKFWCLMVGTFRRTMRTADDLLLPT